MTENTLALAAETYDEDQRKQIAYHVGLPDEKHPALMPFLAVATDIGLSPLTGEIWLLKGRREINGEWQDFYRPAVGRDGYLKKAREHSNWKGIRSGVVCAADHFEMFDDGNEMYLQHKAASLSARPESEDDPSLYRGPVIGAWAKVFYKDEAPPFFFYAPMHEYAQTEEVVRDGASEPVRVWKGTWAYQSAMILKAAQSYVCRIGFGINGAIPVDELVGGTPPESAGGVQRDERIDSSPDEANDEVIDALDKVDDETKAELKTALHEVNRLAPYSWARPKVHVLLQGADQGTAEGVLANVRHAVDVAYRNAIQTIKASEVQPGQMIVLVGSDDPEPWPVGGVAHQEGQVQIETPGGKGAELHPDDAVEVHPIPNPGEEEADAKNEAEET